MATLPHVCSLLSFPVTIYLPLPLILLSLSPAFCFRWACCCRLQVFGTPQPMKNECLCTLWLWWTSPYVSLSLFSIWLPPKKLPCDTHTRSMHTQKWRTLWTKYLSCWRKRLRLARCVVKSASLSVHTRVCVCFWDWTQTHLLNHDLTLKLKKSAEGK